MELSHSLTPASSAISATALPIRLPASQVAPDAPGQPSQASFIDTILARPLFAPTRHPPAGTVDAGEALPRLAGIIIGPDTRSAIFAPVGGKAVVVREGGHTGAYEINAIGPNEVVLSGPDGQRRIHPNFARNLPIQPQIIQGRDPTAPPN